MRNSPIAIIDPDAVNEFGHYLQFIDAFKNAADRQGRPCLVLGPKEAEQSILETRPFFERGLSQKTWDLGLRTTHYSDEKLSTFETELSDFVSRFDGNVTLFMYLGSIQILWTMLKLVDNYPKLRVFVNLFYSSFPEAEQIHRDPRWTYIFRACARNERITLVATTDLLAERLAKSFYVEIGYMQHPSTTFGDDLVKILFQTTPQRRPRKRILFPGGLLYEKGIINAVSVIEKLSVERRDVDVAVRSFVRPTTPKAIVDTVSRLRRDHVHVYSDSMDAQQYGQMFIDSDIVVVPYAAAQFSDRTSGAYIDAIYTGAVPVVIARTWMAGLSEKDQLGPVARDESAEALYQAIIQAIENFDKYRSNTMSFRKTYQERNSWDLLVSLASGNISSPKSQFKEIIREPTRATVDTPNQSAGKPVIDKAPQLPVLKVGAEIKSIAVSTETTSSNGVKRTDGDTRPPIESAVSSFGNVPSLAGHDRRLLSESDKGKPEPFVYGGIAVSGGTLATESGYRLRPPHHKNWIAALYSGDIQPKGEVVGTLVLQIEGEGRLAVMICRHGAGRFEGASVEKDVVSGRYEIPLRYQFASRHAGFRVQVGTVSGDLVFKDMVFGFSASGSPTLLQGAGAGSTPAHLAAGRAEGLAQIANLPIDAVGQGAKNPKLLLSFCASALLLDPAATLARLGSKGDLAKAVETATSSVEATDPIAQHFAKVLQFTRDKVSQPQVTQVGKQS